MPALSSAGKSLSVLGLLLGLPVVLSAQQILSPQAGEYSLAGDLPGDQVSPQIALNGSGGYLVWQDNATDGDGLGISARRISGNLAGSFGVFPVNEQGA